MIGPILVFVFVCAVVVVYMVVVHSFLRASEAVEQEIEEELREQQSVAPAPQPPSTADSHQPRWAH
jgi:hypothetical protein